MIRSCSREACNETYNESFSQDVPFVTITVLQKQGDIYLSYCCPKCASVDLTERYRPKEFPL